MSGFNFQNQKETHNLPNLQEKFHCVKRQDLELEVHQQVVIKGLNFKQDIGVSYLGIFSGL